MQTTPKVVAIHDLSGFGRCSLTVAIPVLSAMGVQCCPLPTAWLSTHTGGFTGYTFLDMTDEMSGAADHWQSLGLQFEAVYSGFMGSEAQMAIVERMIGQFRAPGGVAVVDPVMGDHGARYATYTDGMCRAMARLCEKADVITPNLTEASFLLDRPYADMPGDPEGFLALARERSGGATRSGGLTGACSGPEDIGAACFDRETGKTELILTGRVPGEYHGTGDVFASVLTGALVRGRSLEQATRQAVDFVAVCAERSRVEGIPQREGVDFEPLLGLLTGR